MDTRLGKGLARKRLALYVTKEHQSILEEVLACIPKAAAQTLTAAIFTALREWVEVHKHSDEYVVIRKQKLLRIPIEAVERMLNSNQPPKIEQEE